MKKIKYLSIICTITLLGYACSDFLELEVKNKITAEGLYSDDKGIQAYLASLYFQLPIEDFNQTMNQGFNVFGGDDGKYPPMSTADALYSKGWHVAYNKAGDAGGAYWNPAFVLIRDINTLAAEIPNIKPSVMSVAQKQSLVGEVAFMRAYVYFALAKRYGGVPIIEKNQEYDGGDPCSIDRYNVQLRKKPMIIFLINAIQQQSICSLRNHEEPQSGPHGLCNPEWPYMQLPWQSIR